MKCRLGFGQVKCPVLELDVYRVVMVFVFLAVVVRGNLRMAAIRIDGCLELFTFCNGCIILFAMSTLESVRILKEFFDRIMQ